MQSQDDVVARTRPSRSPARLLGALAVVLALCALSFWAGRITLAKPQARTEAPKESVIVDVTEQSVGRSLTVNTTVTTPRQPLAPNTMAGTLTALSAQDSYAAGDVVYRVDNHPVRVIAGSIPMYRDLAAGAKGADVTALNAALIAMGHLSGEAGETYTQATARAVRAWQKALGIEQTGSVARGEVIIVPSLPLAISFNEETAVIGNQLAGGERLLQAPGGDPQFVMQLLPQQATLIPNDTVVTVKYEDHSWPAVITETREGEGGNTKDLTLRAPDGGVVCGSECAVLPATDTQYLSTAAELVPPQTGPAVPVSALTSQPGGSTEVTVIEGEAERQVPVKVLASQDGLAIVEGVKVGDKVRVFGGSKEGA
ncbi:hypothetical protein BSZ39_01765 [Bowdeniella nasicola]|uniref:Peptidoglycan binding-like domain-containing protein n=1 Tax=Bowdeniella nasicola TaxID=208480 RepID=A0A1Q5Q4T4_9ACTO|nr:peptidoglycan-binding domain-containing protein [Bowdeniella nasicola]OKL54834.1 hypothetical protein BSZ39_01765 [Bowdeniella nasicola]